MNKHKILETIFNAHSKTKFYSNALKAYFKKTRGANWEQLYRERVGMYQYTLVHKAKEENKGVFAVAWSWANREPNKDDKLNILASAYEYLSGNNYKEYFIKDYPENTLKQSSGQLIKKNETI